MHVYNGVFQKKKNRASTPVFENIFEIFLCVDPPPPGNLTFFLKFCVLTRNSNNFITVLLLLLLLSLLLAIKNY